ncbi:MAG: arsenic resistance protein, partial [Bacillota bacterium]
MNLFEKYLTVFVIIAMILGVLIGQYLPIVPEFLERLTVARISLPIGVLIWFMIFPSMLKVDFTSIKQIGNNPKGLYLTWFVNWVIKPFSMFAIAGFFFLLIYQEVIDRDIAVQYLAGAAILGAAPCTAMVFVWSH